jgi:hypothetical protein
VLSEVEIASLSRGAIATLSLTSSSTRLVSGVGSSDAGGNQVGAIVSSSSSLGVFDPATNLVLKRGDAPLVGAESGVGGFLLQWGIWQASEENPATLFTNLNDPTATRLVTNPLVVVNTISAEVTNLTGIKKFSHVGDFLITARGFENNTIGAVKGGFVVDLADGSFSDGNVEICLGTATCDASGFGLNYWQFAFSGNASASTSTGQASDGAPAAISVESFGRFLGSAAEGFVLTFASAGASGANLVAATTLSLNNPDRFVDGAILFNNPASLVFNDSDIASINRLGFALFIPESSGTRPNSPSDGFFFGGAKDLSTANPAFTNSIAAFTDTKLSSGFEALLRSQASVQSVVTDVGGFDLDWGIWSSTSASSATVYANTFNATQSEKALGSIVVASATPVGLADFTGSTSFSISDSLIAGLPANQASHVSGGFKLDLANALINDFRVELCLGGAGCSDATKIWRSNLSPGFAISVADGFSFGSQLTGKLIDKTQNNSSGFTGYFRGVFVGGGSAGYGFSAGIRLLENERLTGGLFGGPVESLDGALLFKQTDAALASALSSAQVSGINRVGNFADTDGKVNSGIASQYTLSNAIFVNTLAPSNIPLTGNEDFEYVLWSALTPTTLQSSVGGFDLQWGLWTDPTGDTLKVTEYRAGLQDLVTIGVEDSLVSISAIPSALNTLTGKKSFDSISNHLITAKGFTDPTINSVSGSFAVDFDTGILSNGRVFVCVGAGTCGQTTYGETFWPVVFQGSLSGGSLTSKITTNGTEPGGLAAAISAESVGHFIGISGEGFVLTFSSTRGTAADALTASTNSIISPDRSVSGAVLFGGTSGATTVVASPITANAIVEPSDVSHGVDWGEWDNPLADNWSVTTNGDANGVTVASGEFFVNVIPTELASMQGSANYTTSAASAFIGGGSAGQLTNVIAGMGVDFDTGAITGGSLLVEVAGSQTWDLEFEGSIGGGAVDLNMTSGQLFNFGEIISTSIDADLGGVFTGTGAEAFVGGFDLVDQIDSLNQVNGVFSIAR